MSMSNQKVEVELIVYTNIGGKENISWQYVRLNGDV